MTHAREPDAIDEQIIDRVASALPNRFYPVATAMNQQFDRLEAKLTGEIDTILRHIEELS